MPMSCQGWEMASGPTVAYNMAGRTNGCVIVESPKGSNFSGFRMQDTISKGFGEMPKSSNYRFLSSQDNVIWGLSTLSLRGQAQADADLSADEIRSASLGSFCCASAESYRCACPKSIDSSLLAHARPSVCRKPLNLDLPTCDESFLSTSEVDVQASALHTHENATGHDLLHTVADASSQQRATSASHATGFLGFCHGDDASEHRDIGNFSNILKSSSSSLHSTRNSTSEDEELEPDTMSDSSFSSENGVLLASPSSSRQVSHDDTEAESAYKEPSGLSCSVGASPPPRKGLSKFYAGKARSFSCLMDAGSVKDLAKPEIPHAKKRRPNSGSSGLPPLQKGVSAISKKPLHSGKSTLALAVAMTRKEEYEAQEAQRLQKSLVPSRSYSLSDLQGATQSIFFIG